MALTGIEMRFVRHYVEGGDAHKAFRDAGLEHGQKHTKNLAYIYLRRPRIRNAIHRLQAYYAHHMGIHASQILGLLHAQATFDPLTSIQRRGVVGATAHAGVAIGNPAMRAKNTGDVNGSAPDGETTREIDIEFADKQRALALLGKHLQLFEKADSKLRRLRWCSIWIPQESTAPKQVGETIDGIGLRINLPDADQP